MSEELLKPKKFRKEPRKRASQTEIYRLPKEIFVFEETTQAAKAALKPLSDKKQMPPVVVFKDESRHDDDDEGVGEGIDHGRRTHPKSPRPSYKGRKFTFEGLSPGGTKSMQSGDIEETTESNRPLIFVKKVALVHEENSMIESSNSRAFEHNLTPPSNLNAAHNKPTHRNLNMHVVAEDTNSEREREAMLCALPTPHASNSALSGDRTGEGRGNIDATPMSTSMLNPFPFDEAATVRAGTIHFADHDEVKNYYSEPRPVSSDEEDDPAWYIEFQIKNGIIAANSAQDDDSVTIGDCHATFTEICGLSSFSDHERRKIPKTDSVALSEHLKDTDLGVISSFHETNEELSPNNIGDHAANLSVIMSAEELDLASSYQEATEVELNRNNADHLATKPSVLMSREDEPSAVRSKQHTITPINNVKGNGFPTSDEALTCKLPDAICFQTSDPGPPSTIEILLTSNTPKYKFSMATETQVIAKDAKGKRVSLEVFRNHADAESHETGHSDLTASSRSIETSNFKKTTRVAKPQVVDAIKTLEAAPSDEMIAKINDVEVAKSNASQNTTNQKENASSFDCEPESSEKILGSKVQLTSRSTEFPSAQSRNADEPCCSQGVGLRQLERKYTPYDIPMGHSQVYLKSSTSEISTKAGKLHEDTDDVQQQEGGGSVIAASSSSLHHQAVGVRRNKSLEFESRRPFETDRKLKYTSHTNMDVHVHRPVHSPAYMKGVGDISQDDDDEILYHPSIPSNKFESTKTRSSPVANNPAHNDDDKFKASFLDMNDIRTITPAPSDEFEQRMGVSAWTEGVPETKSNHFLSDAIESITSVPAVPTDEPEIMVEKISDNPYILPIRDYTSPPSVDNSILLPEDRDDTDEKSTRNESDAWMDQINNMVCGK